MKAKYEKPKTKVILLQGRHNLLQDSQRQSISMDMSGYQKGGDGSSDGDGWD